MVGGLADWFAVPRSSATRSAFRSRTPRSSRSARTSSARPCGDFIQTSFLTPDAVRRAGRAARASAPGSAAGWSSPPTPTRLAGHVADAPCGSPTSSKDDDVARVLRSVVRGRLERPRQPRGGPGAGASSGTAPPRGSSTPAPEARPLPRRAPGRAPDRCWARVAVVAARCGRGPDLRAPARRAARWSSATWSTTRTTSCGSCSTRASRSSPTSCRRPGLRARGEQLKRGPARPARAPSTGSRRCGPT